MSFRKVIVAHCLLVVAFVNAGGTIHAAESKPGDSLDFAALTDYAFLRAELNAASDSQPYLVLDLAAPAVQVRMAGVIVWQAALVVQEDDSLSAREFAYHFSDQGRQPTRSIKRRYLFEAAPQTPDSILEIVGTSLNVPPDSLQRLVPERFRLSWPGGLVLTVVTDIAGQPQSRVGNVMTDLAHLVGQPFREAELTVSMTPEAAITLFRVCHEGMTTLIVSPPPLSTSVP